MRRARLPAPEVDTLEKSSPVDQKVLLTPLSPAQTQRPATRLLPPLRRTHSLPPGERTDNPILAEYGYGADNRGTHQTDKTVRERLVLGGAPKEQASYTFGMHDHRPSTTMAGSLRS